MAIGEYEKQLICNNLTETKRMICDSRSTEHIVNDINVLTNLTDNPNHNSKCKC